MGSNQSKEVERNEQGNRKSPIASTARAIHSGGTYIHDDKVETSKTFGCSDIAASKDMTMSGSLIRQQTNITARSTKSANSVKHGLSNNSNKIRPDKKQKKQNVNERVNITISNTMGEVSSVNVNHQDTATSLPYQNKNRKQNEKASLTDTTEICSHERNEGRDHSSDLTVQESCKLQRSETGIVTTESGENTCQGLRKSDLTNSNNSKQGTILPAPNLFVQSSFPSNRAMSYSTSTESTSLNRTYNRWSNVLDSSAAFHSSNTDSTVLNNFSLNTSMSMSGQYRPGSATVGVSIAQETVNNSADISHTRYNRETNAWEHTSTQSDMSSNTPVSAIQASPSYNARLKKHSLSFTTSNSSSFSRNSQWCNIEANTHTYPNWNELEVDIEVDSPEETVEHHQLTKESMIAQQVREYFSYTNNSNTTPVLAHKTYISNLAGGYITIRNTDGGISKQISAKNIKLTQYLGLDELTDENMGIILERPKHQRYATLASRIQSFQNWPKTNSMSFEMLAEAGFVYTGTADCVRCFYCNGGLREWLEEDCPWTEHARYYPHCPHVRQCKGAEFVRTLHKRTGNISHNHNDSVNTSNGDGEDDENEADDESEDDDDDDKQLEYQEVMRAANEFVTDKALLDKAARYLKFIGKDYFDVQQLVDIVYDIEEGKIDIDEIEEELDEIIDDTDESPGTKMMEPQDIDTQRLAEENRLLKERALCKVCLDATASVLFLDCGHMVACPMCAPALKKCAVCRREIKGTIRTRFALD